MITRALNPESTSTNTLRWAVGVTPCHQDPQQGAIKRYEYSFAFSETLTSITFQSWKTEANVTVALGGASTVSAARAAIIAALTAHGYFENGPGPKGESNENLGYNDNDLYKGLIVQKVGTNWKITLTGDLPACGTIVTSAGNRNPTTKTEIKSGKKFVFEGVIDAADHEMVVGDTTDTVEVDRGTISASALAAAITASFDPDDSFVSCSVEEPVMAAPATTTINIFTVQSPEQDLVTLNGELATRIEHVKRYWA